MSAQPESERRLPRGRKDRDAEQIRIDEEMLAGRDASVAIDGRPVCDLTASTRVRCVPADETARFPCFATFRPSPEASSAAADHQYVSLMFYFWLHLGTAD